MHAYIEIRLLVLYVNTYEYSSCIYKISRKIVAALNGAYSTYSQSGMAKNISDLAPADTATHEQKMSSFCGVFQRIKQECIATHLATCYDGHDFTGKESRFNSAKLIRRFTTCSSTSYSRNRKKSIKCFLIPQPI